MTRYKNALLVIVVALPLGAALAASATPASARDVGPVIAGALGGFEAGAIIGSTIGHGGYCRAYLKGWARFMYEDELTLVEAGNCVLA